MTTKSPVVASASDTPEPDAGVTVSAAVEMMDGVETDVGATSLVAVSVSVANVKSASSTRLVPSKNGTLVFVKLVALVPPFAIGSVPVTPEVSTSPVQFVKTPEVGVPSNGVTSVGDVESTTAIVPVDVVTPVPPFATGRVPVTSVVSTACAHEASVPSLLRTLLAAPMVSSSHLGVALP